MAEQNALVRQWISKAEEDWAAACFLSVQPGQSATTCFHCQQCAEKLFKAALLAAGADIPRIHELNVLSDQLMQRDPAWQWDRNDLDNLTIGAVAMRYPGYEVNAEEAQEMLAAVAELRDALLLRLGNDVADAF